MKKKETCANSCSIYKSCECKNCIAHTYCEWEFRCVKYTDSIVNDCVSYADWLTKIINPLQYKHLEDYVKSTKELNKIKFNVNIRRQKKYGDK